MGETLYELTLDAATARTSTFIASEARFGEPGIRLRTPDFAATLVPQKGIIRTKDNVALAIEHTRAK